MLWTVPSGFRAVCLWGCNAITGLSLFLSLSRCTIVEWNLKRARAVLQLQLLLTWSRGRARGGGERARFQNGSDVSSSSSPTEPGYMLWIRLTRQVYNTLARIKFVSLSCIFIISFFDNNVYIWLYYCYSYVIVLKILQRYFTVARYNMIWRQNIQIRCYEKKKAAYVEGGEWCSIIL